MARPSTEAERQQVFDFESYGLRIRVASNDARTFNAATAVVRRSLLGQLTEAASQEFDHIFRLDRRDNGHLMLELDGRELGISDTELKAFRFFDSILRVTVGESAAGLVFLHAGVVGWRGKAILLPADSFQGKSTLVTELVRAGAEYYSDDFAVLDGQGNVHPFPRQISMRTENFMTYELSVADIDGKAGTVPIPVGLVLLTRYEPDAEFTPVRETPGNGLLRLIPFTLSMRRYPEFSMQVLHKISERAIIISSLRGSAERFVKTLLDFVDNNVN